MGSQAAHFFAFLRVDRSNHSKDYNIHSVAEVSVLDREIGNRFGNERNTRLQIVALGALHSNFVALNRSLNLELALLDQLDDFLGQIGINTILDLQLLLDLVTGDFLDRLVIQALDALLLLLFHSRKKKVLDLVEVEVGITIKRDDLVLLIQLKLGRCSLEVIAIINLARYDIDCILHRHHVNFGGEIKSRHGAYSK